MNNPNNFVNPTTPTITNPIGVDILIQALQLKFSEFSWLEKSFGRAYIRSRKKQGNDYIFPALWQGEGIDQINGLANDNLNSYCFFLKEGNEQPINYEQYQRNRYNCDISVTFWMDLKRVDPSSTYPNTEYYTQLVKKAISQTRFTNGNSVDIIELIEEPQNVFSGFSIDLSETQHLYYPKFGFKIRMLAYFNGDC